MNDRVDFVCARTGHQASEPDDALTMHEDRWAYCPGGAREHHDWRPSGGMSLEDAKQFVRRQAIRQVDTTGQRSD
ncbi:MAG: hypothetical protein AABM40_01790 [Chloroflexota bacterium]